MRFHDPVIGKICLSFRHHIISTVGRFIENLTKMINLDNIERRIEQCGRCFIVTELKIKPHLCGHRLGYAVIDIYKDYFDI